MPDQIKLSRIHKVGCELEGGWYSVPSPTDPVRHDGSVRLPNPYSADPFDHRIQLSGEISNTPTRDMARLEKWIHDMYPPVVNDTCGLHIHVSFADNSLYQLLMDNRFYEYYLDQYKKWGEIAPMSPNEKKWFTFRLNGQNRFCYRQFIPDRQACQFNRNPHRYTHLNYCHAMHGTLESRLLPMFHKPDLAWVGVVKFIDIVETWLDNNIAELEQDLAFIDIEREELPDIHPELKNLNLMEPVRIIAPIDTEPIRTLVDLGMYRMTDQAQETPARNIIDAFASQVWRHSDLDGQNIITSADAESVFDGADQDISVEDSDNNEEN